MLTIHETVVGTQFFPIVFKGMRNSWESWEKSDSNFIARCDRCFVSDFQVGPADLELATRLIKIGDDHGKYLRQLPVAFDLTASDFWLLEFDTYKIGTASNSTSSMHTLGRHALDVEDVSFEDVDPEDSFAYLTMFNTVRDKWIASGKKKATKEWRAMIALSPRAFNYRRTITLNYQVLRHMYHSRKNHRLGEWRGFCDHIQTLPYSQLITVER